jgi:hypothetical protein
MKVHMKKMSIVLRVTFKSVSVPLTYNIDAFQPDNLFCIFNVMVHPMLKVYMFKKYFLNKKF